jgi:dTDP-4-dehydrorhamnose reductase
MITGGKGQLGTDCTRVLSKNHDVFSVDIDEGDIAQFSDVEDLVKEFNPDIIVNCAAYTQVDQCETEKAIAWKVNVDGPKNFALCLEKHGGRLFHFSSDYIFDGKKKVPNPYLETDDPHPLSYYGTTKQESEKAVRQISPRHVIIRTSWMYGTQGHNFLKTMLKLALQHPAKEIKVVNDQFGSPTWSHRLAFQIQRMIEANVQGVYHASAEGYCTWYELAVYFLERMGIAHKVVPCTSEEYPTPAKRPKNSILENRQLKKEGINVMKSWQEDIDHFVADFRRHLINEAI